MNLAVVNEAVTEMNGVEHQFTEEEKNFVVQFAFRSGSKEDTISLIEALAHSADKAESDEIMVTYRSKSVSYTHLDVYKRQMLIHCHPSGNVFPSKADTMMTDRMNKLCELMGIPLIDHIICLLYTSRCKP